MVDRAACEKTKWIKKTPIVFCIEPSQRRVRDDILGSRNVEAAWVLRSAEET